MESVSGVNKKEAKIIKEKNNNYREFPSSANKADASHAIHEMYSMLFCVKVYKLNGTGLKNIKENMSEKDDVLARAFKYIENNNAEIDHENQFSKEPRYEKIEIPNNYSEIMDPIFEKITKEDFSNLTLKEIEEAHVMLHSFLKNIDKTPSYLYELNQ